MLWQSNQVMEKVVNLSPISLHDFILNPAIWFRNLSTLYYPKTNSKFHCWPTLSKRFWTCGNKIAIFSHLRGEKTIQFFSHHIHWILFNHQAFLLEYLFCTIAIACAFDFTLQFKWIHSGGGGNSSHLHQRIE